MPIAANTEDQLDAAAEAGNLQLLRSILDEEKSQIEPEDLNSLLYTAVSAKHVEIAAYLLTQGAETGMNVPEAALPANGSPAMFQAFLDNGWDLNHKTVTGTPLVQLVLDDEPLLKWFLANDVDINAKSERWNSTALDLAAEAEALSVVKLLIEHGASTSQANPLHSAASSETDRGEVMDLFLGMGIDINGMSSFGPRVNKRTGDEDGTPLHAAIRGGNLHNINFLLARGADPLAKTIMGHTALEYAKRHDFDDGRKVLESRLNE